VNPELPLMEPAPPRLSFPPGLKVGTSSWSNADWVGPFYPARLRPEEWIGHYAQHFDVVEVDASFYRVPSAAAVRSWQRRTPPGFLFALKVPQVITHERGLVDCERDLTDFLRAVEPLGDKLGPLLLQFPYLAKGKDAGEYAGGAEFRARLAQFLRAAPAGFRWAVEIRNGSWLDADLTARLQAHGAALVLTAYYTMPSLSQVLRRIDPFTAGFTYARFIGDHKKMDALVEQLCAEGERERRWEKLAVDRSAELRAWIPGLKAALAGGRTTFVFFNNHFAGFAPGTIRQFHRLWHESG
jgi:uncharacterized protein YecE (DUF72 family)